MANRRVVCIALAGLAAAAACGASVCDAQAEGNALRIAAAADLRFAMDEIIVAFRAEHPGVTRTVSIAIYDEVQALNYLQGGNDLPCPAGIVIPGAERHQPGQSKSGVLRTHG